MIVDKKERRRRTLRKYHLSHRDQIRAYRNTERGKEVRRREAQRGKAKRNAREKARRERDINYKLAVNLRSRLCRLLRPTKSKKLESSLRLLGCSVPDFKIYIATLFQPDMSWDNYGEWHLDHIIPVSLFDLTKPEHQKYCFHFSNYQPMWESENIRKRNKIISNVQAHLPL